MKAVLLLAAFAAVAVAANRFEFNHHSGKGYSFEQYSKDFNKKYERHRMSFHKKIFTENLAKIMAHNSDHTKTWKMAVNKFTDMSDAERRMYLGSSIVNGGGDAGSNTDKAWFGAERTASDLPSIDMADLPASVDWRNVQPSIITPVKDQGGCGSCWAHGSVECIESYTAMATGELLKLSRQNLVDCTPNPNSCGGTGGCNGATAELAFAYTAQAGGVATEAAYPYQGITGTCKSGVQKAATVENWVVLPQNNYTALVQAVATIGPLAINADASEWFSYSSGVFTGCQFSNIDINHVIQLAGYGTDPTGGDYWLVRNSWSANWGEAGYIRIQKHSDGTSQWCGPDTKPGDGVGCSGGPSTVTVCGSCGIWYDTSYPTGAQLVGNH